MAWGTSAGRNYCVCTGFQVAQKLRFNFTKVLFSVQGKYFRDCFTRIFFDFSIEICECPAKKGCQFFPCGCLPASHKTNYIDYLVFGCHNSSFICAGSSCARVGGGGSSSAISSLGISASFLMIGSISWIFSTIKLVSLLPLAL